MNRTNEFSGKRVVVMGLGHFGGGIGVSRWLVERGARVTVTDMASEAKLAESVAQLKDLSITWRLGGHDVSDLDGCDLMVVSPAVPKDRAEFVQEARRRGIPLSSEMILFIERCAARRIVGITGSAGKSTTTAMIGSILEEASCRGEIPRAWIGGNIGRSLLSDLEAIEPEHVVVLELSSFQLEDLGGLRWSPPHAVITNIRPNHLDRHGTMEAYAAAKLNIVRFQKPGDTVYVYEGEETLAEQVRKGVRFILPERPEGCCAQNEPAPFSAPELIRYQFPEEFADSLQVPGPHNRINAAAAIAVCRRMGISEAAIRAGLGTFRGLEHRLEFVAEVRGARYFNDSKSTTPESTLIALNAFDRPPIMLIGGADKGMSFDDMCRELARKAKAVICYGKTGPLLAEKTRAFAREDAAIVDCLESVQQAVGRAAALAAAGDVVVLSPACTSYDQFSNFEERGATFREAVQRID